MARLFRSVILVVLLSLLSGCMSTAKSDLSSLPIVRNQIGRLDEIGQECYLYKSGGSYELLFYLTDDRTLVETIKKGTKVKIVQVVLETSRRPAYTAAVREPTLIGRPSLWPLFLWRLDHHGRNGILGEQTVFDI